MAFLPNTLVLWLIPSFRFLVISNIFAFRLPIRGSNPICHKLILVNCFLEFYNFVMWIYLLQGLFFLEDSYDLGCDISFRKGFSFVSTRSPKVITSPEPIFTLNSWSTVSRLQILRTDFFSLRAQPSLLGYADTKVFFYFTLSLKTIFQTSRIYGRSQFLLSGSNSLKASSPRILG